MLCEKCKKRTASVFYNENINGKTRSYSLCGECATKLREKGELQDLATMMGGMSDPFTTLQTDLFGGFFGLPTVKAISGENKCPTCGSTYADIAHSGKVGCPTCYDVFADELARTIRSVHGTTSHTGNVPSRHRAKLARVEQLKRMKAQLKEAIQQEKYEKAAVLRDEIHRMEAEGEGKEA